MLRDMLQVHDISATDGDDSLPYQSWTAGFERDLGKTYLRCFESLEGLYTILIVSLSYAESTLNLCGFTVDVVVRQVMSSREAILDDETSS